MNAGRVQRIEMLLRDAFAPTELLVKDQSHLHAGHAGAQEGKGHFDVRISSEAFAGKSRIEKHRMVYAAVADMMDTDIHALQIQADAPSEA